MAFLMCYAGFWDGPPNSCVLEYVLGIIPSPWVWKEPVNKMAVTPVYYMLKVKGFWNEIKVANQFDFELISREVILGGSDLIRQAFERDQSHPDVGEIWNIFSHWLWGSTCHLVERATWKGQQMACRHNSWPIASNKPGTSVPQLRGTEFCQKPEEDPEPQMRTEVQPIPWFHSVRLWDDLGNQWPAHENCEIRN